MKRMNVKVALALSLVLLVATVAFAKDPVVIFAEDAPAPIAFYSQAIKFGNLVFVSGQLPFIPGTSTLVDSNTYDATKRVMDNIKLILAEAKLTLDDIVMATAYLRGGDAYSVPPVPDANSTQFNRAYGESFDCTCTDALCAEYVCSNPKTQPPARASITAKAIPKNALVEISVIAGK